MPNIGASIKMSASSRFIKRLTEHVNTNMLKRLRSAESESQNTLEELVTKALLGSQVYKSLSGRISFDDLQAEFGLTDDMVDEATSTIRDTLINQCEVKITTPRGITGFVPIVITFSALDSTKYEPIFNVDEEPFAYTSQTNVENSKKFKKKFKSLPKERLIPWMRILLNPSNGLNKIEDIKRYGITYDLTNVKRGISRSGRAIMVSRRSKRPTRHFPYQLPKVIYPTVKGSKNFIEDISLSREFRSLVRKQVEKMVFRVVRRRQALPSRLSN